ncbi:MAG: MauE/DoxX family redox-associated membrane protein [Ferruginibacter sp.]
MKKWVLDIICGLLIVLFVYAASSKFFDYAQFRTKLVNSPMLASYAGMISWLILLCELVIVLMLMVKNIRLYGLYGALFLLFLFTIYIAGMLLSGKNLPCSCGGVIRELSWAQHLAFNLFFMALSIVGIILLTKKKKLATIIKENNKIL